MGLLFHTAFRLSCSAPGKVPVYLLSTFTIHRKLSQSGPTRGPEGQAGPINLPGANSQPLSPGGRPNKQHPVALTRHGQRDSPVIHLQFFLIWPGANHSLRLS